MLFILYAVRLLIVGIENYINILVGLKNIDWLVIDAMFNFRLGHMVGSVNLWFVLFYFL